MAMYSQQEAAQLRKQFWTSLGQYLSPVPSGDGQKINWINYKTGVRFINFKMNATENSAYIAIEISHPSPEQRKLYFDHFTSLKNILEEHLEQKWIWEEEVLNESGKTISRIYTLLPGVNMYKKEDWPAIISFFKSGITAIDRFWVGYREMFEL
jgi:hypothetical protein